MQRCTMLLVAVTLGCAGGNDPGETNADLTTATTTATTAGEPEPMTTSTTTSASTSSSTTEASSTETTDGDTSTGIADDSSTGDCPVSTEGCPCDMDADPACGAGLSCAKDGVCEAVECKADDDEPNDDPFEPFALTDLSSGDDPISIASQLTGSGDVDWFQYACDEPLFGLTAPSLEATVPDAVRACLFVDCSVGGNPTLVCPEGSEAVNGPVDNRPGCCFSGPGAVALDNANCPDSNNDETVVTLRFDGADEGACDGYSFAYGCG